MCNNSPEHLTGLMERTEVVPAVNQVELHPHFTQQRLQDFDAQHGIITQSWSPVGGVNGYVAAEGVTDPLQEPTVTELAAKYGKTLAQVVLRWPLEHGLCAIPKSVKAHCIAENVDVFDFTLTPEEVAAIDALDTGVRGGPNPDEVRLDSFS
jgi:diketogulonate reductase-like aldo/keto reductase